MYNEPARFPARLHVGDGSGFRWCLAAERDPSSPLDDAGTTYDESTALIWDASLSPGSYAIIDGPFYMNNLSGNLGVRSDAASELTFTAFGRE